MFHFCILAFYVLVTVTFCAVITVSPSKGSTVFCKLEFHVLSCVLLRNVQFDFRFFLSFFPLLWPFSRPDVSITKK